MLNMTYQKTINGTSTVNNESVAFMSASIQENGAITITKNISNIKLYNENKKEVRADLLAFEQKVNNEEDLNEETVQ